MLFAPTDVPSLSIICTIPLLYNNLFVQNLNLQHLVCTKLENKSHFLVFEAHYLPKDALYCCSPLEPTKSVGLHLISHPMAN